jgi:DNA-binding beta-propeller fold protein YncE
MEGNATQRAHRRFHRKHRRVLTLATLAAAAALLATAAPAGADTGTTTAFLRTLGGPNHAEMYSSGMEVAPDGSLIVADTGNDQVAKYTAAGVQVWRVGTYGTGTNQFWNPRDIGVDSTGNIYVADSRNNRIVKLDPNGAWIGAFLGPTGNRISFPLGVSVSNNLLYVADSGKNRVRVWDLQGNQTREFTDPGSGTCDLNDPRDADADPSGNVYIANYKNHNIVKLSATGTCLTNWATGTIASNTPYGVRVAPDPVENASLVYVALGNEDTIEVYRQNGNKVGVVGGQGGVTMPGTFEELRRVAVAPDGDIWGADLWGWRLERFNRTATGWTYAQSIGAPLPASTNSAVFHQPHQVAFSADGTVNIVDTVHHRVVRMSPTGQILKECGRRGSAIGQYNWPRGVAVDPVTGYLWVANTKQYNIHVIRTDTCGAAPVSGAKFGTFGAGLNQFNWPHAIVIRASDRIAFIADTNNHRIVSYNVANRTPIAQFGTKGTGANQFQFPTAVALSPVDGHLFVADSKNNRIVELTAANGGASFSVVRSITGGFSEPQGVAVDPQGRIIVADTRNHRVVILQPNGTQLGTLTSFTYPESVSVDPTGRIYVSDTYADRVQVYEAYESVPPPPDTTTPDATVTVPAQDQSIAGRTLNATGMATDNVGVASVGVAIKNRTTNLWWRANGTWGTYQVLPATLGSPGASSTTWSFTWNAPAAGQYSIMAIATDTSNLVDPTKPTRRFVLT